MPQDEISLAIESAMRAYSPPLGSRITPEQDLAKTFGVGRFQIRQAMDELVSKGLVFRRRGSGTYIKALPESAVAEPETTGGAYSINPEQLFDVKQSASTMRFPEGKPGSLRIGLWSDLADMPATHHRILAGASQRASEQNQYLSVHSIVRSRGVPLSPEELGRQLRSHPSDVYIVAERWAEQFNEAFAGAMPRTMFFNSSRPLHRYEPVVGLDNEGIVEAGVKQLHSAGSQNIAILALDVPDRPLWEELEAYRRTLRREGLDCQNIQTCTLGRDSARQASLALLAGPDRPEAVYVADDHLLEGFVDAVEETGLQIGRDLAVVTLSNAGVPLPPRCNWSRVEFDLVALGELLIDTAERLVRQGPERTSSCLLRHKWIPGVTHWK